MAGSYLSKYGSISKYSFLVYEFGVNSYTQYMNLK